MDTNTLQVIEKFGSKLDAYIEAAATKAGMAVEYFWPVYVRQQYITGISVQRMVRRIVEQTLGADTEVIEPSIALTMGVFKTPRFHQQLPYPSEISKNSA